MLPEGILGDVTWDLGLNVDAYAMIRVVQPDIQFIINDTNLDELSESSVPYDPAAHRWWCYRDEAGVIDLETSPDLDTWTDAGAPLPSWSALCLSKRPAPAGSSSPMARWCGAQSRCARALARAPESALLDVLGGRAIGDARSEYRPGTRR